jgi:hypothetical protein
MFMRESFQPLIKNVHCRTRGLDSVGSSPKVFITCVNSMEQYLAKHHCTYQNTTRLHNFRISLFRTTEYNLNLYSHLRNAFRETFHKNALTCPSTFNNYSYTCTVSYSFLSFICRRRYHNRRKVSESLCTVPWRRMGSEGIAPPFLTSTLDEGEWSASRTGRFIPEENIPGTHWIGS